MFFSGGVALFIIPAIIYLALIGYLLYLVHRFIRSKERIADNTASIAQTLRAEMMGASRKSDPDSTEPNS